MPSGSTRRDTSEVVSVDPRQIQDDFESESVVHRCSVVGSHIRWVSGVRDTETEAVGVFGAPSGVGVGSGFHQGVGQVNVADTGVGKMPFPVTMPFGRFARLDGQAVK